MDNLLITVDELREFRHVSNKFSKDRLKECIQLAQRVDLREMLGDFVFDVYENKDTPEYADLMSGGTFTISNENYQQEGIKAMLADLAYARYLYIVNTNQSPFGMVQKINQDSEPIERSMIKDLVKMAQQDAGAKFELIDWYLRDNSGTFPRYCKVDCSNGMDNPDDLDYKYGTRKSGFSSGLSQKYWVKK